MHAAGPGVCVNFSMPYFHFQINLHTIYDHISYDNTLQSIALVHSGKNAHITLPTMEIVHMLHCRQCTMSVEKN